MKNWPQTVLSQYQGSSHLMALLASIEAWLSPDENYEDFYTAIWNIDSAVGYGLDVWGRIVGVPRTVTLTGVPVFGFEEAGDREGFDSAPFWEAGVGITENFVLADGVYRRYILAKAAYNITDGSTRAINAIMMDLFANRGNCYVLDGRNAVKEDTFGFEEAGDREGFDNGPFGDQLDRTLPDNMTVTYVFEFATEPFEKAMAQSGVLPRPTGVAPFYSFLGG